MGVRYELHIWTKNADLVVADRIVPLPCDNDDDAADAWERHYEGCSRIECVRIENGLRETLKAAF